MARRLCIGLLLLTWMAFGCAAPLDRLADRIEKAPPWWWGYVTPQTDELRDTQRRLRLAAGYLGITISVEAVENPNLLGTFNFSDRTVRVNETLPFDAQVQVVAHEMAHSLQPPGLPDEPTREIFADAVAFLVVLPERDDLDSFAMYLARFKDRARLVIRAHRPHILWAASVLRVEIELASLRGLAASNCQIIAEPLPR